MRKLLKLGIVAIVAIVLLLASVSAAIIFDLSSLGATYSETLKPSSTPIGRTLVVYAPGFSGAAKQDATKIAEGLQAKGYTVVLAGVQSESANDKSGYSMIVAGGPMYWGQVSGSIDGYLKTLPNSVKLGVFGSTGSSAFVQSDFDSLQKQVAANTNNANVTIKLILDGNETIDCADLVSKLAQ